MVVWVCRTTWALLLRVLVVYRRRSLGWIASSKTCSFCCSHLYSIIAALFCGVSVVYLLRCRTYSLCSARALYDVEHNNLHTVVFFFLLFFPFSFSPQQTLLEQLQRGRGHYYFFYYLSAHSFFLSAMVVSHVKILSPQSRRPLTMVVCGDVGDDDGELTTDNGTGKHLHARTAPALLRWVRKNTREKRKL